MTSLMYPSWIMPLYALLTYEQGHAVGQYNLGLLYSIEHVLTYSGFVIRAPYILRNSPIKIINTLFAEYMRNRFVQLKVRKEGIQ